MNSISSASISHETYTPATSGAKIPGSGDRAASSLPVSPNSDSVELSPEARQLFQMGRIAFAQHSGAITADQATSLRSELSSTEAEIKGDKAANAGKLNAADVQSIEQTESQTSQEIYSDAHNGATPTASGDPVQLSAVRSLAQITRVAMNEKAGNLSSSQAANLFRQIKSVAQGISSAKQAGNGTLTADQAEYVNQIQSRLGAEIQSESANPPAAA